MDSIFKDIRYGVRGLLKQPGFTAYYRKSRHKGEPPKMKPGPRRSFYIQVVASAVSVLGLVLAVVGIFWQFKLFPAPTLPSQREEIAAVKVQLSNIDSRIEKLEAKLDTMVGVDGVDGIDGAPGPQGPPGPDMSAQLKSVESSIDGLASRFTKIEGLIVQDPSKVLEIPLLRKDLDTIKEANQIANGTLRQDLERAYSLLVGTMIALAIAVLAPLISNIFGKKPQPEK